MHRQDEDDTWYVEFIVLQKLTGLWIRIYQEEYTKLISLYFLIIYFEPKASSFTAITYPKH